MDQFAYARVSSTDQNLDRQLDAFAALGIAPENIFTDKSSGHTFDRTGYHRLLSALRRGDLLYIESIDRLGRNYDAIIDEWTKITKGIGADIAVLDMPLLDTRNKQFGLTGRLILEIVLQLLSYVAQKEREDIKKRQRDGIAAAKSRGVIFGRPQIKAPENLGELIAAYLAGATSLNRAAQLAGMSRSTFYARVRAFERDSMR